MNKPLLNIVVVGNYKSGKSTLIGRLLYEIGKIPEDILLRLKKHAKVIGDERQCYSFYLDKSLEERQGGGTIEPHSVEIENTIRFNIIDTPGNETFIKNTISSITYSDVGVVVIDRNRVDKQTEELLTLLYAFEIEQLIVVINKLDLVDYNNEIYIDAKEKINKFLELSNFKFKNISYVPVAAYQGENITLQSSKIKWYDKENFYSTLNLLPLPDRTTDKQPFRMTIQRTFNIPNVGVVITGRVISGKIKLQDEIIITPYPPYGQVKAKVNSIESSHQQLNEATTPEDISISLTEVDKKIIAREIKKGYIVGGVNEPPQEVEKFKALIRIISHPTQIKVNYAPYLHCHLAAIPVSIIKIENKEYLTTGDIAEVWLRPHKPLVIEEVNKVARLGKLVLRDGYTVAIGECIETIPKRR